MSADGTRIFTPRRARRLAAWIGVALCLGPAAGAQEQSIVLRLRAQRLASEGRCDEAIPLLRRVGEQNPKDARAALLEGKCAMQLRRYADAVAPLERARRLTAEPSEADLYLTIALYHIGDFQSARSALEGAEKAYPDRAEVHLYGGLLLLHQAESLEAAGALERARALDAEAVEPVASYYAGLAWQGAKDRERAEEALRRVQEQAPGTVWAEQAERALARTAEPPGRFWWAIASAGFQYDDNVVLRGKGVDLPENISDNGSPGGVWSVDTGVELWRHGDWAAGLGGYYVGSAYTDFSDFDEQTPGVRGWLDHRINESLLARLELDFEYTWLDYDKYVAYYGTTGGLFADLGDAGSVYGFLRFARANFLQTPPDFPLGQSGDPDQTRAARNRDGNEVSVGFDYWRELDSRTLLRGGYSYTYYDSRGSEYDLQSHEFALGLRRELPWDFAVDLSGSVELRPYDNPSTFPDPPGSGSFENSDRDEQTYRFDVVVERPIKHWLTGSLFYSYEDNDSNVDVYDYDRNVVGFLLTVHLPN